MRRSKLLLIYVSVILDITLTSRKMAMTKRRDDVIWTVAPQNTSYLNCVVVSNSFILFYFHWRAYFSKGLKPPTRKLFWYMIFGIWTLWICIFCSRLLSLSALKQKIDTHWPIHGNASIGGLCMRDLSSQDDANKVIVAIAMKGNSTVQDEQHRIWWTQLELWVMRLQ